MNALTVRTGLPVLDLADDLPDPLPRVSGDAADVDLADPVAGSVEHRVGQLVAALVDRLLSTAVGARGGFEFAGHVTSLADPETPNKFGLRTPNRLCQTEVRNRD